MLLLRRSQQPGHDLTELLWENGPALRRTAAATPFPPFAFSAAGTSSSGRAQELAKNHPASASAMRDLLRAPDDDAVPWLHYPVLGVDDDDSDTAPLPPEYGSTLLSGYSGLHDAVASRDAGGAPSTSHCAVVVPPPMPEPAVPKQQQPPRPSGEGIMNFTFFSRPLQRPPPPAGERASVAPSNPVESTVLQASTNRLRSTPLFSEQRMAWLQTPRESRATAAAAPPPPPAPTVPIPQGEASAALAQILQPEATAPERPPPPPPLTATTSSVCSDNVDRSQLKRSSSHQAPEWSVSLEDEDLDDEAGGLRRSAGRSTKRGRTAEVHNMSERMRRDRINEKMRALQELIPNCNKIDKASMLEEAIEYLKTLQLQVQMMSTMGTAGLCMPPMLAMQHMQMPTMAHFHHHHLGAMGFGMGAFDPRLVGAAQFPYPMIPGAPMFGHGHTMPPPPPFPQHPMGAPMVAPGIVNSNAVGGGAEAEQQTSSDQPQVPRAM